MDNEIEKSPEERAEARELTREILYLAEQCSEHGIQALPGDRWSLHYPLDEQSRAEMIERLRQGEIEPSEVAELCKPDALIFNASEIKRDGVEKVGARIRDVVGRLQYYDYRAFAQFLKSCPDGTEIDEVRRAFESISVPRVQKKMYDAYGSSGKKSLELAMQSEIEQSQTILEEMSAQQRIALALKSDWLAERMAVIPTALRDELLGRLSDEELKEFEELRDNYIVYVEGGDATAFETLSGKVTEGLHRSEQEATETAEREKAIREELEKIKEEISPPLPGQPKDPAIPPQDQDEYHTPPPQEENEESEKEKTRPIFEITPAGNSKLPLTGYYCSGRKSYYDIPSKTWSKNKRLESFSSSITGEQRQTISGYFPGGLVSVPIPNGYALDSSSLTFENGSLEIKRDQNGCFYLESGSSGEFKIDFLKENPVHDSSPIAEDSRSIVAGKLSDESESFLASITGSDLDRALQIAVYIHGHHYYPGGGDLELASALQYKLRNESAPDEYIQNLEESEYLECYSANTLYLAMLRKIGIPCRIIHGHHVQGIHDGKGVIDETTGHAWSEVWDGIGWRRIDATPAPKPAEKKEEPDEEPQQAGEEALDGGMDSSGETPDEKEEGKSQASTEADGDELEAAKLKLEESQKELEKIQEANQQLRDQLTSEETLDGLQKLKQQAETSEVFDEMKQDLQQKIDAKMEKIKDEMEKSVEEMVDSGFVDEQSLQELKQALDQNNSGAVGNIMGKMKQERELFNAYETIKEEVMPFVDKWLDYFLEKLPKEYEVETDEDSRTRQGSFDKRAVMKPRNLIWGTVKNPRALMPSVKPRFIASIMIDVSGSMQGEKLENARKLLVFYNELFSAISARFGYMRFSISTFADGITDIKSFDQDYDSSERYEYADRSRSTIKNRLMTKLATDGGTDMLPAIQKAATELNEESFDYPDHATALYFVGDGGDTSGNAQKIREFLALNDQYNGFGNHLLSAILIGQESEKRALANIFGEENTSVAPDLGELLDESMVQFDRHLSEYMEDKAA